MLLTSCATSLAKTVRSPFQGKLLADALAENTPGVWIDIII